MTVLSAVEPVTTPPSRGPGPTALRKAPQPIATNHGAQWHRDRFAEFTQAKAVAGEPSPHMTVVGHLSRLETITERWWRAGCYAVPYSVITAEALWTYWPYARILAEPDALLPWVREHWAGLHTRTERRCVRSPEKFSRSLASYAKWMHHERVALYQLAPLADPKDFYDAAWDSISAVYGFGRYISIRVIELLRRYAGLPAALYDIRAIGGWSPVRMLTLLWPEHQSELLKGDAALAERLGYELLRMLREDYGISDITPYRMAAMLCEARKAYENRDEYPGHAVDQELASGQKYRAYWEAQGLKTQLWAARAVLFPTEGLGEVQGWDGLRHALGGVLRDYEYVWSDLKYDYVATKNFAQPVLRAA